MKIIKTGKVICELPDEPKNFDGGCKGGKVWMTVGDDEIVLSIPIAKARGFRGKFLVKK